MNIEKIIWLKLRFIMAFIFLWAFFDKVFGLGFSTKPEGAWINGGSPTYGFLTHGTKGPFAEMFQSLAGIPAIDWLFMIGLLCIGISFLINRYVLWGAVAGGVMLFLMWLAALLPENNPIVDDHIVYIFVLALLALQSRRGKLGWK